jgi:hypothetical protein
MRYLNIIFVIIVLLSLSNCEKDAEILPKSYPYITLDDIIDNSSIGVGLKAKIVNSSNVQIEEFGFVLDLENKPTITNRKVIVGIDENIEQVQCKIESDLLKDESYSVRAYVKTNNYIVYSNEKSFTSNGCMAPKIKQIYPDYGSPGKLITIVGEYFSESEINNIVKFDTEKANVTFSNKDTLIVQCPIASSNNTTQITVEVAQQVTTSFNNFNIINTWTKLDNFPGGSRYWSSYFTIGDKGYVSLGNLNLNEFASSNLWEYDVNNRQWQSKSEFPGEKRMQALSFSANGFGYIGLGYTDIPNLNSFNDLWQYNTVSDSWEKMEDFPGNNAYFTPPHFVINNKLYLTSSLSPEVWVFDPLNNNWTALTKDEQFQDKWIREGFSINNKGYFIETIGEAWHEKGIVIWKYDDMLNRVSLVDTILTESTWIEDCSFNIANKIYFSARYGKLIEYDIENKLDFYHIHYSDHNTFNFMFLFEDKAILNNSETNEVYEFYPQ